MFKTYIDLNKPIIINMNLTLIIFVIIIIIIVCGILLIKFGNNLLFVPFFTMPDYLYDKLQYSENGISYIFDDKGNNTPILIHSHGNAGNISNRLNILKIFEKTDISVLIYDYRGFGASNKNISPTTETILVDGDEIYNLIISEYPGRDIILCGESMGSAVTWYLASKHNVKSVIITSGYASLSDVINDFTFNGIGNIVGYLLYLPDNTKYLSKIKCPVMLMHASDDSLILKYHASNIYNTLINNGNMDTHLLYTTGGHNFSLENYSQQLFKFLDAKSL